MSPSRPGTKNSSGATIGTSEGKSSSAFLSQITHNDCGSALSGEDIRDTSCASLPKVSIPNVSAINDMFMLSAVTEDL